MSNLVVNPEGRFSHVVAHIIVVWLTLCFSARLHKSTGRAIPVSSMIGVDVVSVLLKCLSFWLMF